MKLTHLYAVCACALLSLGAVNADNAYAQKAQAKKEAAAAHVKVDRRKGAVIALDVDRMRAVDELRKELQVILAKSSCKNISRQEVHELIDEIYEEYGGLN